MALLVGFAIAFAPTALAVFLAAQLSQRSREEWQLLAWVPPMPLVGWWLYFVIAALRDPASHNLLPFELAAWSALSVILFAVFLVARRLLASHSERLDWRKRAARRNGEVKPPATPGNRVG